MPTAQRANVEIVLGPLGARLRAAARRRGRRRRGGDLRREARARRAPQEAEARRSRRATSSDLEPGDFVVHTLHGVGVYSGLTKLPLRSRGGGRRRLPAPRVRRRRALPAGVPPRRGAALRRRRGRSSRKLDKLGGEHLGEDARARSRPRSQQDRRGAAAALRAARRRCRATRFPPPRRRCSASSRRRSRSRRRPIRQKAIDDVLGRHASTARRWIAWSAATSATARPRSRCAPRCKAVLGGKQVAVLAPTTVLVEQHSVTFAERFAGLPGQRRVAVALPARKAEQQKTVDGAGARARSTSSSAPTGCSRATCASRTSACWSSTRSSASASTHKERIKKLRTQVDVLTLTATPIPRTLHMAMCGLREISIIATPPADRLAIRTFVCRCDDDAARRGDQARAGARRAGLLRPQPRRGHRTSGRAKLRELAARARASSSATGRCRASELEKVMVDFVDGKLRRPRVHDDHRERPRHPARQHDDRQPRRPLRPGAALPAARAHRPLAASAPTATCSCRPRSALTRRRQAAPRGAAALHRAGRRLPDRHRTISRSAARATCSARKQSGAIAAVGFETYAQMLEEAVAELRGEPITHERDPELTCDVPGFIPDDYVPDIGQRLEFYRRLSQARDEEEVRAIARRARRSLRPAARRGRHPRRHHDRQGPRPPPGRARHRADRGAPRRSRSPTTRRSSRPR